MDPHPEPPEGVGPHEGRELTLMLAGEKPLAMFCDIVPSPYAWPDAAFDPHVASGRLVKDEIFTQTPDGRHTVRHLYYALPGEAWRIQEAHALSLQHCDRGSAAAADACARIGRLLGYREEDIQAFLRWAETHQAL
ncbi:hypothetical protein [uncultured Rhodospira sp.]|uniref:hypothetical protein n=1 Tax=uncultured Rhodospira sp. TaxID=1936189 RepID=UPI00262D1041|nr:hypothetical protein [uncultured Rhodospira sp.]